eukprot:gene16505-22733_t
MVSLEAIWGLICSKPISLTAILSQFTSIGSVSLAVGVRDQLLRPLDQVRGPGHMPGDQRVSTTRRTSNARGGATRQLASVSFHPDLPYFFCSSENASELVSVVPSIACLGPGGLEGAGPVMPEVYAESEDKEIVAFQEHQQSAQRISPAVSARSMVELARWGILSTTSPTPSTAGYPMGAVIEFGTTKTGHPIFAVSTLSPHTKAMAEDGKFCLTVMEKGFSSLKDARFSMQGKVTCMESDEAVAPLREAYLRKHPDAFYVDFGDFR